VHTARILQVGLDVGDGSNLMHGWEKGRCISTWQVAGGSCTRRCKSGMDRIRDYLQEEDKQVIRRVVG
jgi:hypothetical protein